MAKTRWITVGSGHRPLVQVERGVFDPLSYRALVEELAPSLTRTLRIEGRVANLGGRKRRMPKLAGMTPFDHRGHLIGLQFGGPDVLENLIPMHGLINEAGKPYYAMESEIQDLLGVARGEMVVTVDYGGTDALRPDRISVRVHTLKRGNRCWHFSNFSPYLKGNR